jgi:outer membrane lipoprotein
MMAKSSNGPCGWIMFLAVLLAGCASGLSEQARSQVTYAGDYGRLQRQPEAYRGKVVLFGGRVLNTQAVAGGTEIEVLQLPLNSSDQPRDDGTSQGRFLVVATEFMDPAVYQASVLVTVVGEVIGQETRAVGSYPYTYPKLRPIEVKTWEPGQAPRTGFSFGVGGGGGRTGVGVGVGTWF